MSENLIYRTYQEGDEHGILELFKECFGHDLTLPFWEWKYKLAPGGGPRIAVAQESNGKIVAAYNVISLPALVRGKEGVLGQCVDIMVHPQHRGRLAKQGVLVKTFKHFCSAFGGIKVHFLYGFAGRRHWILGQRTGIYYGGGQIPFFKKRPERQRVSTRLKYSFRPLDESRFQVIDTLWRKVGSWFSTGVLRDSRYARWRFKKHPKWSYLVYLLSKRPGTPVGWCALRHKGDEVLLVDFVVPKALFLVLLEKVEEVAWISGSRTVSVAVPPESWWAQRLFFAGYRNDPTDLYYSTSFMGPLPAWADEQVREVFYTMGDMDIL